MLEKFTRQEVLALSGVKSSRLAYLERIGAIAGERFGSNKKPTCLYNWQDVFAIASSQHVRKALQEGTSSVTATHKLILQELASISKRWEPRNLFIAEGKCYWSEQSLAELIIQKGNSKPLPPALTVTFIENSVWRKITQEIWSRAARSTVIDFDRFKTLFPMGMYP